MNIEQLNTWLLAHPKTFAHPATVAHNPKTMQRIMWKQLRNLFPKGLKIKKTLDRKRMQPRCIFWKGEVAKDMFSAIDFN